MTTPAVTSLPDAGPLAAVSPADPLLVSPNAAKADETAGTPVVADQPGLAGNCLSGWAAGGSE